MCNEKGEKNKMLSNLIYDKNRKIDRVVRDTANEIQKIIQRELSEYQVKVNCCASLSEHDSVEIMRGNKRVVFYISNIEGSHVRKQNKNYNFLYDYFANNEIKEIRERLEKLFI